MKDEEGLRLRELIRQSCLSRGITITEAVAIISSAIQEGARDGKTVAELMQFGGHILTKEDVMDGVSEMIDEIQIEATFIDGTKLVTVHQALYTLYNR